MGRNFSPARKVLSITAPSAARLSLVRTNAPPLPGLTCWNSTILKTVPSTSMWEPFLNWFVETTATIVEARVLTRRAAARSLEPRCGADDEDGPAAGGAVDGERARAARSRPGARRAVRARA